jgi:hypothetical protein
MTSARRSTASRGVLAIELRLSLAADLAGPRPQVRAFVDLDLEQELDREIELAVDLNDRGEWATAFVVPKAGAHRFHYRIGVAAREGTPWALVVSQLRTGRILLSDADSLAFSKNWFVGTCELPEPHEL